jgi:hypothetical protein
LQAEITPLRAQLQELGEHGTALPSSIARAMCTDVRTLETALWTFVTVEGVEPNNNAARRDRPTIV